jgi:hypothetical protein
MVELTIAQLIAVFGIPSAITGLAVWWVKRRVEASEKKNQEQQENIEALIMMIVQSSKANQIGIQAIARAVQRIPDAKCNGDMTAALAEMEKIQQQEKQFLINKGIKYIFE